MGATHFSGPVYSGGVPLYGTPGLIPMSGGRVVFVDPELGSDGNDGSADNPKQTLTNSNGTGAYDVCVSGRGDIVVLKGGPTSSSTTGQTARLSSAFTWAKNNTHLVGIGAPTMVAQRSRIGWASTVTLSSVAGPMFTISGSGCRFENVHWFDDAETNPVAVSVTGQRNYFANCHIAGMGDADGGDDAAATSLFLNGGDENTFVGCYIGLDTIARSTTNAEITLEGAATRNIFQGCFIASFADNAGHLFVKIDGSGDIDRFVWFKGCMFYNAVESTATTMTQAMDVHNTCGGMVILQDCALVGATDWAAADNGNVFISNAAPTAGTSGIAVAVTR